MKSINEEHTKEQGRQMIYRDLGEKTKRKYVAENFNLAFDLVTDLMTAYASKCKTDPTDKKMDPILGSYLLSYALNKAILHTAGDEYEYFCAIILSDALEDAIKNDLETEEA